MNRNRPDIEPLRRVGRLRPARRRSLEALAPFADVVRLAPHREVVARGERARQYLALVEGEAVELDDRGDRRTLTAGTELGVDELRAGTGHRRRVWTRTDCTFVVVEGRAFLAFDMDHETHERTAS